jgi:hypothetical protein
VHVVGFLIQLLERRHVFERLAQRNRFAGDGRDELGHLVHFGERDVEHAPHVAHRRARGHRAEGDDLRHLVVAVALGGILQHARALIILEVEVDIRHRNAAGVEEALEDQPVFEGIHQRDVQGIGHQRAGGGAARVVPDAAFAGKAAQVPHDEEVGVEPHGVDDIQLVRQALGERGLGCPLAEPAAQPLLAQLVHVAGGRVIAGDGEIRKVVALERKVHLATLRDEPGVVHRLRHLGEEAQHLLLVPHVVTAVRHPHAVGLGHQCAGLDAQQDVVRRAVLGHDIMHVVGGHQLRLVARRQVDQLTVDRVQLGDLVVLQLEEEMIAPEDLEVPIQQARRVRIAALHQGAGQFRRQAARGANQACGMRGKEIVVDAGLVVEALQLRGRGDLEQVAVAGVVLGQEQQVKGIAVDARIPFGHAARGEVGLHTDTGRAGSRGGVEELNDPKASRGR